MVRYIIVRSLKDILLVLLWIIIWIHYCVVIKYMDTKGKGATDRETEKQMFSK